VTVDSPSSAPDFERRALGREHPEGLSRAGGVTLVGLVTIENRRIPAKSLLPTGPGSIESP